jgi:curved DNA-binding protein CbpA
MARTFYDVLDVDEDAEKAEIRRTYRAKAKEHHPDVSDDPAAGERFKRINRAAEVLGDPVERKRYDRMGHDAYVASEGDLDATDRSAEGTDDGGSRATATDGSGSATDTAGGTSGGGATAGATGPGTANGPGTGTTGPWGPDPEDVGHDADPTAGGAGSERTTSETDGPWTGFRDAAGPGTASTGGSIGTGARSDRERTARWERAHDHESVGRDHAREAWNGTDRPPRKNAWLVALSMVGSGRIVDQWSAFRRGLLLVYLYPVLLAVLLAQISPPVTVAAAALTVFVAIYGSGIPNVGTLVFGLLGGLITVFLVESPYALSSPTSRVLLAACWVPLGHSLVVAWLLHRSRV